MSGLVDLIIEEAGWQRALPDLHDISTDAAALALGAADLHAEDFAVSLLACDDDRISALNGTFRTQPRPTNVLAWPATDLAPAAPGDVPLRPLADGLGGRTGLGDVAIALQTCLREAENAAIPLKNHVTHLILHGCLHLLGYDHQTNEDAARMEDCETTALAAIGIPDPYA